MGGVDLEVRRLPLVEAHEGLDAVERLAGIAEKVVAQQHEEPVTDRGAPAGDLLGVEPTRDVGVEPVGAAVPIGVEAVALDGQRVLDAQRLDAVGPVVGDGATAPGRTAPAGGR